MEKEQQIELQKDFSLEIGDGKTLETHQRDDGTLDVKISANEKTIFDFGELLPENYKFVNNEQATKLGMGDKMYPGMRTNFDNNRIIIGNIESPKDILQVLHEIGHAQNDPSSAEHKERLMLILQFKKTPEEKRRNAKVYSIIERRAWAYAINQMRNLDKKVGLDRKSIFPNFSDLKTYIDKYLSTYRENAAESTLKSDPDFEPELRKLFDRWQYIKP